MRLRASMKLWVSIGTLRAYADCSQHSLLAALHEAAALAIAWGVLALHLIFPRGSHMMGKFPRWEGPRGYHLSCYVCEGIREVTYVIGIPLRNPLVFLRTVGFPVFVDNMFAHFAFSEVAQREGSIVSVSKNRAATYLLWFFGMGKGCCR